MVYRYRKTRDREKLFLVIAVAALILSVFSILISQNLLPQVPNIFALPELSTIGYVKVQPDASVVNGRGVVVLTGGCYEVTATTEATQAISIANGLMGRISFRPNSHDLMKETFDALGIDVVMVKVIDMRNQTYIGRLILRQGNKVISLDSRPSDGTAIAVRTGSPIYMKESLMKEYGRYIC